MIDSQKFEFKVACFGAGFVGLPTSSVLALHNPNVRFMVYDISLQRIQACSSGKMPIFEPNLEETVAKVHHKNLSFTCSFSEAVDNASVIFLALPTPTKSFGEYAGRAYDLSYTEKAIQSIVQYFNTNPDKMASHLMIVEKSTVPMGTARMIQKKIGFMSIHQNQSKYSVASNPEFLAEGTAISDLMNPDRIVIGLQSKDDESKIFQLYNHWSSKIIKTSQYSSELSKLAANCFLAQRVSSINSFAMLCETYEADITEIKACLGSDHRIGDKFLNSSVGFGGSCFQKDILALVYLAEAKGLTEVADYWLGVIKINDERKKSFFRRIYRELNGNLRGKTLTIFGTAFKKETSDARESPAIDVCYYLLLEQVKLQIYDPKTSLQTFISEMQYNGRWSQSFRGKISESKSCEEACQGSYAIIILTEWDKFITLNYGQLIKKMKRPAFIFDGRNILDEKKVMEAGFQYCKIGKTFHSYLI